MAAYLVDNPPIRSQYRNPRRAKPTGTVVLHTAEIAADLAGEDLGAEKIASFIRGRDDYGSYHLLGDRDSEILLVPLEWEAFHDGTGSNPWSIGVSLAITAAWFRSAPDQEKLWYMARLATMVRRASDWLEAHHGITVPARRLTPATANQPGICTHMDREMWKGTPGRRSDPWGNSDGMWHLFLTLYEDTAHTLPEDDVKFTQPEAFMYAVASYVEIAGRPPGDEDMLRDADAWSHVIAVDARQMFRLQSLLGQEARMRAAQAVTGGGINEAEVRRIVAEGLTAAQRAFTQG